MDPYDEDQINGEDKIIRRINPDQHVVWDDTRKCKRISTKAFSPSSKKNGGMSVDIEALILQAGKDPQEYVITPVFIGAVSFSADSARDLGLLVGYDPIPKNEYHGEVWGRNKPNRFSRSQKRGLNQASEWYVQLPDVEIY
jgi:hypothetical protein